MKKVLIRLTLLLVLGGGVFAAWKMVSALPAQKQSQIPTTPVRKGDVIVRSYARGELRAVRSATLTAPNLFGTVQVTKLAALGAFAKDKDLVVEFDDAEVLSRIEDKQLELDQTDEQLRKQQAELAIRNNQDQVELLQARYSVRRAELEVKRNELISSIDAKKNLLSLEEARRRLQKLESDIKSRLQQAEAELAVLRERKNKGNMEMARERARLSQVKLLSPMSGLVAVKQNRGGFMGTFGMQVPDIREGDQVQPGIPVVDILDLSELEVVARVGELDRANLREGQEVLISLDAVPDKKFNGKIKSMSGTASANLFSADPAKKFDVVFSIDMPQLLSALGAKPEQIQRIMATAEANRKKPPMAAMPSMFAMGGMPGGMPGGAAMMMGGGGGMPGGGGAGGPQVMVMQAPGGMAGGGMPGGGAEGGGMRQGGGGFGGMMGGGGMSPEQMQKMRDALQKALAGRNMRDLSAEDRQKVIQEAMKSAGVQMPAGMGAGGGRREGQGGEGRGNRQGGEQAGEGGERRQRGEGQQGGGENRMRFGPGGPGGPGGGMMAFGGAPGGFSQKDLENAKLPPPPEEDSQLDVLLRPGLLADVEIIVEKVPNAVYVPNQAVFEKEGKPMVYVKSGNKWDERVIKIAKRSESTTIIESGVTEKDVIALADPNAKPGDGKKKKSDDKGSGGGGGGGNPMGGLPAGGGR
ncbi:MAG: efflux RND transporter periplasmic adaptor subunit [Bryobacteraceae bacterium]|nr:efflux RND transporter periplasmic adaptor subunit [Bryobacteraceae bacterium]